MKIISDLACELLRRRPPNMVGITIEITTKNRITTHITTITDDHAANFVGKPIGTYVNIDTKTTRPTAIIKALHQSLETLITNPNKILCIGLGNDKIVADSLGPRVLNQVITNPQRLTFQPGVAGATGINSVDAIQAICNLVHPTAVIIIDSLVSADPERIGTNYQICTSGITPGSGLGRDNQNIDQKLLGVPVIAIGIPVCTILTRRPNQLYHVVPKDIDIIVNDCAAIIARAINTLA